MTESQQQLTPEEKYQVIAEINRAFTPNTPIKRTDLFAGREDQIDRVFSAVFSPGQHAAIYGERGVGKTSLANIIYDVVFAAGKQNFIPARVNCSHGITFAEIWREIFKQMPVTRGEDTFHLDDRILDDPNSEEVRGLFEEMDNPSIVVIDEFDLVDQSTATLMADTIKTLSDRATDTTLVLVGVADSLDQLIQEHESVARALVQVQMPRMSYTELLQIVSTGMDKVQMTIAKQIAEQIANLSQGLPHYTHLVAKHAALSAVKDGRREILETDYDNAIKESVKDKLQTLGMKYQTATHSPKDNIFAEVLLACAFATNEFGLFSARDVRDPLTIIFGKSYDIQAYIRHLNKFSQGVRGPILEKKGETRRFQYKFVDPLMQPYVVMKGLADGLITDDQFARLLRPSSPPGLF
jgi:Cdc6-like AAA superfamily ATPase